MPPDTVFKDDDDLSYRTLASPVGKHIRAQNIPGRDVEQTTRPRQIRGSSPSVLRWYQSIGLTFGLSLLIAGAPTPGSRALA
jgi:hypothetical protein